MLIGTETVRRARRPNYTVVRKEIENSDIYILADDRVSVYLSCRGNSYEEPIMVSFVIVELEEARITGAGRNGPRKT